jgi:hypothetical protein
MSGTQVTLMSSDDKVYSMQLYGTKFVGNMRWVSSCLRVLYLLPIVKLSATILWKERLKSSEDIKVTWVQLIGLGFCVVLCFLFWLSSLTDAANVSRLIFFDWLFDFL